MKRAIYLLVLVCSIHIGCFEDRLIIPQEPVSNAVTLRLNEVVYTGSDQLNEFGKASDWIEIHVRNSASSTIDSVFISDDPTFPRKFGFAGDLLLGSDHLIIWCDDMDTLAEQIHSNFKLSSSGEEIVLSLVSDSTFKTADRFAYPIDQQSGQSYGRVPDGVGNWSVTVSPTPGSTNQ